MAYKLFVDSDVIIDFFTDREPYVNPASELFELFHSSHDALEFLENERKKRGLTSLLRQPG